MAQNALYKEGLRRVKEYKLNEVRFDYKLNLTESKICDNNIIIKEAIEKIPKEVNIEKYKTKIYTRKSIDGFYMNWHFDDCAVFKHSQMKKNMVYKNSIVLNEKYTLFFSDLPVYTMIIYMNTYGKDFTGGEFNFIDKQIKPEKYQVLFFDSRELHKVNKVTSGERETILIKFYNK